MFMPSITSMFESDVPSFHPCISPLVSFCLQEETRASNIICCISSISI